jgi:RimJ/RimL family protein N-acetyltransferase
VGLSYAVVFDHWNRGLATEMAQASLGVGFNQLAFQQIDCWTLPINFASQHVMEKLGFRSREDIVFAGLRHRYYRITGNEWTVHQVSLAN